MAAVSADLLRPSVWVVEDDDELRGMLVRGLEEDGFAATSVVSGHELMERIRTAPPDLLVLDIGLPDADGRDVCQALRAEGAATPVLFLTARDAITDRLGGFAAGGDDYLVKPFEFAELVARLHALLRRAGAETGASAQGLRLDPAAHAVFGGGSRATLTPTEFRLLARLIAHPGEAVRRRELIATGWPHGARVRDNTLDAYIARLRRKLSVLPDAPAIATVHGVGYRLQ
jgi:two-component system, OmpR family, response regulator